MCFRSPSPGGKGLMKTSRQNVQVIEGAAGKHRIDSEWSQTDLKDSADVFPMICLLGCPQVVPQCT